MLTHFAFDLAEADHNRWIRLASDRGHRQAGRRHLSSCTSEAGRRKVEFMRFHRLTIRDIFACIGIILAAGFAGCGDNCYFAFSDNGKGGLVVKAGSATQSCSLKKVNAAIRVVAHKSPVCETCTAAAQVEHVVAAVRRIQLRSGAASEATAGDWIEVAPELASEPREIDLMGSGRPEMLVENAIVPAGSYSGIRVEFSAEPGHGDKPWNENACGAMHWNCLVMGDGHTEPLLFSGDVPQLDIPAQVEGDSFVLLPDSKVELQLRLDPRQVLHTSDGGPWTPRHQLHGSVTVVRQ